MFKKIIDLLFSSKQEINLNINVEIKNLNKFVEVLSPLLNSSVILKKDTEEKREDKYIVSETKSSTKKEKKVNKEDPTTVEDVASIFREGGIEKGIDKTGDDIFSKEQGKSTDDKILTLKKMKGKRNE